MTWTAFEVGVLARAVARAPSVHQTQPWVLEPAGDAVELFERPELGLPRHDATGRDRLISCGAALANLELGVLTQGKTASVLLLPEPETPELLARVRATGPREVTEAEAEQYSAIFRRHSYRSPFSRSPLPASRLRSLAASAAIPDVRVRVVDRRRESAPLAKLLSDAAKVLHDDADYQRELAAWVPRFPERLPEGSSLPWAGLVRADTRLPDVLTIAQRLEDEGLLVFVTDGDARRDRVLAGSAMQRTWLTAITDGLVASVLTQPLHVEGVRAGLRDSLGITGFPQLILRLGYPASRHMPLVG